MWPFKRKPSGSSIHEFVEHRGTWQVARGKLGKDVLFSRFDRRYDRYVGDGTYTHMLGVAVDLPRLPGREDNQALNSIEDTLRPLVESSSKSVMIGVLTLPRLRQFIFYTSEPETALELVSQLAPEIKTHSLIANADPDPDWRFYRTFAMNEFQNVEPLRIQV